MNLIAKTTCPYCGVGCGVEVGRDGESFVVRGDLDHPANRGKLCIKGSTLAETLDDSGRLLSPMVDGKQVDWSSAISTVADRIKTTSEQYGPGAIAFYLSGQLLTEDYYIANKLIKGFIGSANVDTNSRLCMASAVAAQKRSFGEDLVTGNYEDLEEADLVVMVGSNAAWTHPILYQRMIASRQADKHKKLVVIDPRRTDSAEFADLFLPIRPGQDLYLFGRLFRFLHERGKLDRNQLVSGTFEETLARCPTERIGDAAQIIGIDVAQLQLFFNWFAETDRVVSFFSQGVNQSKAGTDTATAIINCHVGTGRIGKPGASAFSVTGQPNAMGGREVGGLANQLAAHMDYTNALDVDRVRRFWDSPRIPLREGHKAVDLFRAIERKEIRFVWIMATNPLVSLPAAARWEKALVECDTVVVSDCVRGTDTTAVADILLPAAAWGEKEGTVTNSERCISRQRAFREPVGEARPDWWIIKEVAAELGFGEAFAYENARDIFIEHAKLSSFENDGKRVFNIGGLGNLSSSEYDRLAPVQWPVGKRNGTSRLAVPAKLVPVEVARFKDAEGFVLNTGRLRDQWHSMTRTGVSTRLLQQSLEPLLEINSQDASTMDIASGDIVEVTALNASSTSLLRASITDSVKPGSVFAPIHFSDQLSSSARIDNLVAAVVDPISGQPASKHARVNIKKREVEAHHLLITPFLLDFDRADYWVRHELEGKYLSILAGQTPEAIRPLLARLGEPDQIYEDTRHGEVRRAWRTCDRLQAIWFHAPTFKQWSPWWLFQRVGSSIEVKAWSTLLYGLDSGNTKRGQMVCTCFQVTDDEIAGAVSMGAETIAALGQRLACGTNCGSCVPAINRLLRESVERQQIIAVGG